MKIVLSGDFGSVKENLCNLKSFIAESAIKEGVDSVLSKVINLESDIAESNIMKDISFGDVEITIEMDDSGKVTKVIPAFKGRLIHYSGTK